MNTPHALSITLSLLLCAAPLAVSQEAPSSTMGPAADAEGPVASPPVDRSLTEAASGYDVDALWPTGYAAERRLRLARQAARAAREQGGRSARTAAAFLRAQHAGRADPDREASRGAPRQIDGDPVYLRWLMRAEAGSPPRIAPMGPLEPRVSYGADLEAGKLRAVVALTSAAGDVVCTGTLFGRDSVVSAAHCFCEGARPTHAVIGLTTNRPVARISLGTAKAPAGIRWPSQGATVNACKSSTIGRDITLIRLSRKATRAEVGTIVPAATVDEAMLANGETLMVTGFGHTETGRIGRKALTTVPVTNAGCRLSAGPSSSASTGCVPEAEFVSMLIDRTPDRPSAGPCTGDSGGPAFVYRARKLRLVGVVSRASKRLTATQCGDIAVYTALTQSTLDFLGRACRELEVEGCPLA